MTRPLRVLFYVQHLLGIGHLKRALLIADALHREGVAVQVVSGGLPARLLVTPHVDLFQLPAVRAADAAFSNLVDGLGDPIDEAFKADRRYRLIERFRRFAPHALVIEAFPFGRRQLRFELIPLLEEATRLGVRPKIVCSVRDIVQEKRDPVRLGEQVDTVRRFFDLVLVHGDPNLVPLDASFSRASDIADRIAYTGFVCGAPESGSVTTPEGLGEVLVSAGGGAVGTPLLEAAMAARPRCRLATATWRVLVGDNLPADDFDRLSRRAPQGVIVERARADFSRLLANCAVSVSQGGYNTVMEILRGGAPSVVVPFRGAGETEQALRAEKLRSRGLVHVVDETLLTPERLAAAIDAAAAGGRPPAHGLDLDGAACTARLIAGSLGTAQ